MKSTASELGLRALKLRYERFVQNKRIDKRWVSDHLYRRFINVSSVFCLCYEISIIGKAFQKYKHPQGRAGQRAIHEFISKGKILLDLLLLLLAVLEAISIKFYRDIKE